MQICFFFFFCKRVNYMKQRSPERRATLHCCPSWHLLADVSEYNSPQVLQFISLLHLPGFYFPHGPASCGDEWLEDVLARLVAACSECLIQWEALYVQSEKITLYSGLFFFFFLLSQMNRLPYCSCTSILILLPFMSTTPDLLWPVKSLFPYERGMMATAARRGGQQLRCKRHSSLMGKCIIIDSDECTNWG